METSVLRNCGAIPNCGAIQSGGRVLSIQCRLVIGGDFPKTHLPLGNGGFDNLLADINVLLENFAPQLAGVFWITIWRAFIEFRPEQIHCDLKLPLQFIRSGMPGQLEGAPEGFQVFRFQTCQFSDQNVDGMWNGQGNLVELDRFGSLSPAWTGSEA